MYEEIEKKLNDVGVEIVYFHYTKGTSSTKLGDVLTQVLEERRRKKQNKNIWAKTEQAREKEPPRSGT